MTFLRDATAAAVVASPLIVALEVRDIGRGGGGGNMGLVVVHCRFTESEERERERGGERKKKKGRAGRSPLSERGGSRRTFLALWFSKYIK